MKMVHRACCATASGVDANYDHRETFDWSGGQRWIPASRVVILLLKGFHLYFFSRNLVDNQAHGRNAVSLYVGLSGLTRRAAVLR